MSINVEEVVADLQAHCAWVNDRIVQLADSMDFEEAVAIQDELRRAKRATEVAISFLDGQMLVRLEAGGPRRFGTRTFERVKDYTTRYDHDILAAAAVDAGVAAATNKTTGEVNAGLAAELAVAKHRELYLSDSTSAKVGVIDKLGVDRRDVVKRVFRQWKVSVVEREADDDDDG